MADAAPRHPATTTADAAPYAPYAVLAVAAAGVAGLFALLLLVLAVTAWRGGQPFVQPMMLLFPIAAIILSFAARRQIRIAEGTRAGLDLATYAWWVAVIGGLGYGTYLFTFQLGVREDAANSFRAWAEHLKDVNPTDPKDKSLFYVIDGTLDPESQGRIREGQAEILYRQRRNVYVGMRQSFPVRIATRNRGQLTYEVGGLDNWEQDSNGQKGNLAVKLKVPEGEYAFSFPMTAKRVDGQWKWQIAVTPNTAPNTVRVTNYGQLIRDMELSGYVLVNDQFIPGLSAKLENPGALTLFGKPLPRDFSFRTYFEGMTTGRMATCGAIAGFRPAPADYDKVIDAHFVPLDKDPAREADQRRDFRLCWKLGRILRPGQVLTSSPDVQPILTLDKDKVELRVPCELQPPGSEVSATAARGAVVLRCDDKAFMAKLNALRESAAGDELKDMQHVAPPVGEIPWYVHHIESDMKTVGTERGPGGPGGPPGGPPGGQGVPTWNQERIEK